MSLYKTSLLNNTLSAADLLSDNQGPTSLHSLSALPNPDPSLPTSPPDRKLVLSALHTSLEQHLTHRAALLSLRAPLDALALAARTLTKNSKLQPALYKAATAIGALAASDVETSIRAWLADGEAGRADTLLVAAAVRKRINEEVCGLLMEAVRSAQAVDAAAGQLPGMTATREWQPWYNEAMIRLGRM